MPSIFSKPLTEPSFYIYIYIIYRYILPNTFGLLGYRIIFSIHPHVSCNQSSLTSIFINWFQYSCQKLPSKFKPVHLIPLPLWSEHSQVPFSVHSHLSQLGSGRSNCSNFLWCQNIYFSSSLKHSWSSHKARDSQPRTT